MNINNLEKLKGLMKYNYQLNLDLKEAMDLFKEKNSELYETINRVQKDIETIKEELKTEALEQYKLTNVKKLTGGLGIRVSNKLFYEESEAIDWCTRNMPIAIKQVLDKKSFETIAKSGTLDFVKLDEVITVTFPSVISLSGDLNE